MIRWFWNASDLLTLEMKKNNGVPSMKPTFLRCSLSLDQESANQPTGQHRPLPVFVNKVLSAHHRPHPRFANGCFLAAVAELSTETVDRQSLKYLPSGLVRGKSAAAALALGAGSRLAPSRLLLCSYVLFIARPC